MGNPLRNVNHVQELDFDNVVDLMETAVECYHEHLVINEKGKPHFKLEKDFTISYISDNNIHQAHITRLAFTQLCKFLNLPTEYLLKCFDYKKEELAIRNIKMWSMDFDRNFVFKVYDGIIRGVVSENYKTFSNKRVVQTLKRTVDMKKYMLIQSYTSPESLVCRFIEREPIKVTNDKSPIWNGFMVTNSDVGTFSLKMQDFLYRQWCTNGMTSKIFDGVALKQRHIGENMSDGKIELFAESLRKIEETKDVKLNLIEKGANHSLNFKDYQRMIEKTEEKLKLSNKASEELESLVGKYSTHGYTYWSVANGITELAQEYSIDRRMEIEEFAGTQLFENCMKL